MKAMWMCMAACLLACLASAAAPAQKNQKQEKQDAAAAQSAAQKDFAALVQQANSAMSAKDWQMAVTLLQQLIAIDPNNWQFYANLGDAEFNLNQFDQARDAYGKGVAAAEAITTVDPKNPATDPDRRKAGEVKMLTGEGQADLKLQKNSDAIDAYTKAAALAPSGTAYYNLCALQFNAGNSKGALDACEKAIAADPMLADAYYIKGSVLLADATVTNGKVSAPNGTVDAFNKYLQLAPNGSHAASAKAILQSLQSNPK